jgi:hypothetical protein
LLSSVPITVTPRMASQNRCDGPKASAHCARTGVRKDQQHHTEHTAHSRRDERQLQRARPLPLAAMVWPSSVVAILAGAPGIFSRIALTAPPATVDV